MSMAVQEENIVYIRLSIIHAWFQASTEVLGMYPSQIKKGATVIFTKYCKAFRENQGSTNPYIINR